MKMRPRFPTIRRRHERGIMLVDCLVYIAIWMVVTGLAFSAFYRSLNYTRQLNRYTDDIALTMQVGERWREDIRRATAPLQMVGVESSIAQALHIPQKTNEVIYLFIDGMVLRQAQTNAVVTGLVNNSNAWITVSGSTAVNTNIVTINPANGAVFYRLVYP